MRLRSLLCITVLLQYVCSTLDAQVILEKNQDPELQKIDVIEHLGDTVPMNLQFKDEHGAIVQLSDYFEKGKPIVLTMAYYRCPMLCTMVLNAKAEAVKQLAWLPGREFQMLTVSIDPNETPELASNKKDTYLKFLDKSGIQEGWHFLVGDSSQSKALADALGFKYFYDENRKEYAHPAVVFVITEKGIVSRYLYGIRFAERDMRLALMEASEGKIGSTIDRIIMYCFHYDPNAKGYVVMATNVMKLGGLVTLVVLGVFLTVMWRRDKTRSIQ
ncbi:MAG TPA: SCO family protein [bacterium]|nr:SCO family protein [bacterium]HMW33061.1 SCO family protein [bacterium]HMW37707.1 SCO family protein [bacterium]HMY35397.1 SCO family protein [bacterium]HMZ05809.1 SCO family protein [bacterium]